MPGLSGKSRNALALAFIVVALTSACRDVTDPVSREPDPGPGPGRAPLPSGAIRIVVATDGPDSDEDGYQADVDGATAATSVPLPVSGSSTVEGLHAGLYFIELKEVADNCAVVGSNRRQVSVTRTAPPAIVEFSVTCTLKGELAVSITTSGEPRDPDGYSVRLARGTSERAVSIPVQGGARARLTAGRYTVEFRGIASNCALAAPTGALVSEVEILSGATTSLAVEVACAPPAVSELAFVRDGRIHVVRSDGTGVAAISTGPNDSDPAWSRDGRIAFVRNGMLHVMDADGSNVVRLTSCGNVGQPTWSPDSRRIAFAGGCGAEAGIVVTSADPVTAIPRRVGFERGWIDSPAWSPDGTRIAYTSDWRAFDFVYEVWTVDPDTEGTALLVEGPSTSAGGILYYFQPAWSPDGRRLAATRCTWAWVNCGDRSAIVVAEPESGGITIVAETVGYARPTWSPEGGRIAYAGPRCAGCADAIFVVDASGGAPRLLVENGRSPAWRW